MKRSAAARVQAWLVAAAMACGALHAGQGLAASKSGGKSAEKKWHTLDNCRYQERNGNDADSFDLHCATRKFVLRLYFVDAPETSLQYGERVQEQATHFGTSIDETLNAGKRASEFVHELLRGPFLVMTKRSSAPGRSKDPRFYGLVQVGGHYLHETLLAEGLARVKGVTTALPDGTKSSEYLKKLQALESQARIERKGVWARSSR
jgi:endonuclease YncB( thermonuclease family)